ncbi:hypothetical protein [Protofrankia symbiont of Coriaria ruscifolia]|uniref:hypothetical protein n=1 Tax=Protofrankia symbiont of Coriaria ruscifolia TaxID=1306542 RepID=UPI0013EFB2F2|nr:hypothetical protein [Protofrankia symbiont of Coriaria ruscifolia]
MIMAQIMRGAGPSLYGVNQQTFRQALIAPALLARQRHLALLRPGLKRVRAMVRSRAG